MEDIEYAKLNHKKRRGKPQQNRPHLEEPSTIVYADIKTSHIQLPVEDTKPNVTENTLIKYGNIIKILIVIIIALSCSLVGLVSNTFLSHRSSCPENNSSTTQSDHHCDAEFRLIEIKEQLCVNVSRVPEGCSVCPGGWLLHRESCYYIYSGRELRTWNESRVMCERMEADLLIIEDKEEKEFIDRSNKGQAYTVIWIGLYRDGDGWRGVDGQRYDTGLSPLSGEPSGNCMSLQAGVVHYIDDCQSKHRWICERKALKI